MKDININLIKMLLVHMPELGYIFPQTFRETRDLEHSNLRSEVHMRKRFYVNDRDQTKFVQQLSAKFYQMPTK
jgi:hypothetical protein